MKNLAPPCNWKKYLVVKKRTMVRIKIWTENTIDFCHPSSHFPWIGKSIKLCMYPFVFLSELWPKEFTLNFYHSKMTKKIELIPNINHTPWKRLIDFWYLQNTQKKLILFYLSTYYYYSLSSHCCLFILFALVSFCQSAKINFNFL